MKTTLYFIGNDQSKAKNSYLAVASMRETAEAKLKEIKGATCIVEKVVDLTKRRK